MNRELQSILYEAWVSGTIVAPGDVDVYRDVRPCVLSIMDHYDAAKKDYVFLEVQITERMTAAEENAFMQGLQIGYGLGTGTGIGGPPYAKFGNGVRKHRQKNKKDELFIIK